MSREEVRTEDRASGDLFIRDVFLPKKGDSIPGHCHNYDHTMFFMKGKATVTVITSKGVGDEYEMESPDTMLVPKGVRHAIKALTDDVRFSCVFNHRDKTGNVTDEASSQAAYF